MCEGPCPYRLCASLFLGVFWFLRLGGDQFQRLGDFWGGGWHDVSDCVVTGLVGVVFDLDWGTVVTDVSVRSFDHLGGVFSSSVLHVSGSLGDDTVLGFVSKMYTRRTCNEVIRYTYTVTTVGLRVHLVTYPYLKFPSKFTSCDCLTMAGNLLSTGL